MTGELIEEHTELKSELCEGQRGGCCLDPGEVLSLPVRFNLDSLDIDH